MRKLTFEGFLKQYVAELSGVQTASVHKLADRMAENPRLKEPLFLYALAFNKVELLLRYTANSTIAAEYEQLSNRYSLAQMLLLLENSHLNCQKAIGKSGAAIVRCGMPSLQTMTRKN